MSRPAFLQRVFLRTDAPVDASRFPGSLPFVKALDLRFDHAVTFFVGENGSGKSTLLEAIAELCRLPVGGGGRNELSDSQAPHKQSELAPLLRAAFTKKPMDGYFFRAEFQAHFASVLDTRRADPDFMRSGDPYERYGGRSLYTRSHGEAFLAMFKAWMAPGLILMDEPEAALSPQRQLALLVQMANLARRGEVQFIIATHSPIILTYPGAALLSFDGTSVEPIALQATSHFQITRDMLNEPERYWNVLLGERKT